MSHSDEVRGPSGQATGYEVKDADIRTIVTSGVVLTVFVIVVMFGLLKVYDRLAANDKAAPEPEPPVQAATSPPTLVHQRDQLIELHSREDAELSRYGWIDRKAGVVQVPIDRAIDLVAERGLPAGKGPKTDVEINSHAGTPAPAPVPGPLDVKSQPSGPKQ